MGNVEKSFSKTSINCLSLFYLTLSVNPYKIRKNKLFDLTYFYKKYLKISEKYQKTPKKVLFFYIFIKVRLQENPY